uniref:Uncharacterized protein n=1 Tax=Myripristis murdjan TaxID=586833 RepID=A0A667ZKG3_9TELE
MEQRRLLLAVTEITLALEPLKLAEGGGGVLVEADGVAPEHHRHVLDLVPVDPGQDLGPTRVRRAVRDPVQDNPAASQDRTPSPGS